jgi:hypothetical protein
VVGDGSDEERLAEQILVVDLARHHVGGKSTASPEGVDVTGFLSVFVPLTQIALIEGALAASSLQASVVGWNFGQTEIMKLLISP